MVIKKRLAKGERSITHPDIGHISLSFCTWFSWRISIESEMMS